MSSTVSNFLNGLDTGSYNEKVRFLMQESLDRLSDDNANNVEYHIYTKSLVSKDGLFKKFDREIDEHIRDLIKVFDGDQISDQIEFIRSMIFTVNEDYLEIDRPGNKLKYENTNFEGVLINISAKSLKRLYNLYKNNGLFDLNIRKYIRNQNIDQAIKTTISKNKNQFWFYNNGIIIACRDFTIDGNKVKLYNVSIVNGGQTTTLIGENSGTDGSDFFIPCKIVAPKNNILDLNFFTTIAESTNSQKPILARDLKSNSPEMRNLKNWLKNHEICLEIKRGEKPFSNAKYKIKNDEFGQLLLSFVHQRPGTARSGKKSIFENEATYNVLYKKNYAKNNNTRDFIIDVIDLHYKYNIIEDKVRESLVNQTTDLNILQNGKQAVIALIGLSYMLVNGDLTEEKLTSSPNVIKSVDFNYGSFIRHYKGDDIDNNLFELTLILVQFLSETYERLYQKKVVTSISNFLKSDKNYIEEVIPDMMKKLLRKSNREPYYKYTTFLKKDKSCILSS